MQIGPRIRVGGTLGAIGEGVKHAVGAALPVAAVAAPFLGPLAGALSHIPGLSSVGNAVEGAASHIPGVGAVEQFLGNNGGVSGVLSKYGAPALMAAQGLNAANLGKQSTEYAHNAMDSVNQSYNDRAPLRAQGIASMLHPQTPNLGSLQQIAGNSPYAPKGGV